MIKVTFMFSLLLFGCHHQTPPEAQGRAICDADGAYECTISIAGATKTCTDGKGFYCARCLPTDPSLNWCALDGANSGDTLAGRWYTCVSDCNFCTPAEVLRVDPRAKCTSALMDGPTTTTTEDLGEGP